jgi:putative endonuclease
LNPRELGRKGEALAARYLQENGWVILGRNERVGSREIDLVATRDRVLAFIEVKTRRGEAFGDPVDAISRRKMREVAGAAAGWLRKRGGGGTREIRFDAIGIVWPRNGPPRIRYIPDAWWMK